MTALMTIIDGHAIWQTIWTGALAGVGVCVVFAFTIVGVARSTDMRRDHRSGAAALYTMLAVAGALASLSVVVFAVVVITTK